MQVLLLFNYLYLAEVHVEHSLLSVPLQVAEALIEIF